MMNGAGAAAPIVSLAEAKAFGRIETGDEDATIAGLVRTASALCESFIGQVVIAREFSASIAASPDWQRLSVRPVRSVTSVSTIGNGGTTPLPTDAYAVDIDSSGDAWIRSTWPASGGVIQVGGIAGMADSENEVPEPIRHGVLRLVAHLFAARDGSGAEIPAAVTALWRPYRRIAL